MPNLSKEVIQFAAGNTDFYTAFQDFYAHDTYARTGKKIDTFREDVSLSDKKTKIDNAFFAEVGCVTLNEVNQMEEVFLRSISFSLFVTEDVFLRYYSGLYQRVCMTMHPSCTQWHSDSSLDVDSVNHFMYPPHAQFARSNVASWTSPQMSLDYSYESFGYANMPMDRSSSFDSIEETHWYCPVCIKHSNH